MEIKCPSRYVAMLVEHLEGDGFDCTQALALAGIDRQSFQHLDAVLPIQKLAHVSHLLVKLSGRPELFLATGMTCGPAQYGELGRAILSCATLRDSIHLSARYYPLITRLTAMAVEESNSIAEVCWRPLMGLPYDLLMSSFDFVLGAFYNRLVLVLGNDIPDFEVHFSTAAPQDASRYRRIKPGRFYFAQGGLPVMRLRLGASTLDKPMPLANPVMLQQAEERVALHCQLTQRPQRDWKAWVAMMLRETIGHQPTLDELAVMSHISSSTLTRHLAAQDCTFRQLSNDIRHERACAMLSSQQMRVSDVAQALGYTTPGNFVRAFKAQCGMSPTQFVKASAGLGAKLPLAHS